MVIDTVDDFYEGYDMFEVRGTGEINSDFGFYWFAGVWHLRQAK